MDAPAPVRPGEQLDWVTLERYLRAHLPSADGPFEVLQFPNGSANLTYLLRFGDTELVLRRPPFGVVAPGAHDMKREYRVLSKLWRSFDRAPRAYLFCDDHSVIGADFVVMDRRHGEVVRDDVPASMAHHPDVGRRRRDGPRRRDGRPAPARPRCGRARRSRSPRRVHRAAGRRLGVEVGPGATRQRAARDGRAGRPPRRHDAARRRGPRSCTTTSSSTTASSIRPTPTACTSIFDWDMTTLGEPLVDLGTLLNYWPDPSDGPDTGRVRHEGLRVDGAADPGARSPSATPSAPGSTSRRRAGTRRSPSGRPASSCSSCTAAGSAARAPTRGWRRSPTASRCSRRPPRSSSTRSEPPLSGGGHDVALERCDEAAVGGGQRCHDADASSRSAGTPPRSCARRAACSRPRCARRHRPTAPRTCRSPSGWP